MAIMTVPSIFSDCVIGNREYVHEDMWTPDDTKCSRCACQHGKVVCDRIVCDCNDPHSNPICCPQCDPNTSCTHPAKSNKNYLSGQKWIDQCQTCECLVCTGSLGVWAHLKRQFPFCLFLRHASKKSFHYLYF